MGKFYSECFDVNAWFVLFDSMDTDGISAQSVCASLGARSNPARIDTTETLIFVEEFLELCLHGQVFMMKVFQEA